MNNDVLFQNQTPRQPTWPSTIIQIPDNPKSSDDDIQIVSTQNIESITVDDDSDVVVDEPSTSIIDVDKNDDDDDDIEIIETVNTPIVIEDNEENHVVNPINIIKRKQDRLLEKVCKKNELLSAVIEEAISLDNTNSMKRIIQKTLVPLYLNSNIIFRESDEFLSTLKKTLISLQNVPHLKFSHIKNLCDTIKYSKINLKPPITIEDADSTIKKRKQKHKKHKKNKKKRKQDDEESSEKPKENARNEDSCIIYVANNVKIDRLTIKVPPLPKSDKENMVTSSCTVYTHSISNKITIENCSRTNLENKSQNIQNIRLNQHKNKANKQKAKTKNRHNKKQQNKPDDHQNISNKDVTTPNKHQNTCNKDQTVPNENQNELLCPHYTVITKELPPELVGTKVEAIEKNIALLKADLEKLEEMEVTQDDDSSPYIKAEVIKSKIVEQYKYLCKLMGYESTKRHEVKLRISDGHPPGPARCLEEYINDNIDEHGNPPFPDIFEVVKCVERANEEDRLSWNRRQIVAEAQSLLKQYGQAIQKQRKKREWRDMVNLCKREIIDPADSDPVLEAKLLQNSRIAKKNEDAVLEKYAKMEKENNPALLRVDDNNESDTEDIPRHTGTQGNFDLSKIKVPIRANYLQSNSQNLPSIVLCPDVLQTISNGGPISVNRPTQPNASNNISLNTNNMPMSKNSCPNAVVTPNLQQNLQVPMAFNSPVVLPAIQSFPLSVNAPNILQNNVQISPNFVNTLNTVPFVSVNQNVINATNITLNDTNENRTLSCSTFVHRTPTTVQTTSNFNPNVIVSANPTNYLTNSQNMYFVNSNKIPQILPGSLTLAINPFITTNSTSNIESNSTQTLASNINNTDATIGDTEYSRTIIMDSNESEPNIADKEISNKSSTTPNTKEKYKSLEKELQQYTIRMEKSAEINSDTVTSENNSRSQGTSDKNVIDATEINDEPIVSISAIKEEIADNVTDVTDHKELFIDEDNNIDRNELVTSNPKIIIEPNLNDPQSTSMFTIEEIEEDNIKLEGDVSDFNRLNFESDCENIKHETISDFNSLDFESDTDENDDLYETTEEIEYKIKIKEEREDIAKLLSEIGNECRATVFDIQDPFLVIEISDSSDDED